MYTINPDSRKHGELFQDHLVNLHSLSWSDPILHGSSITSDDFPETLNFILKCKNNDLTQAEDFLKQALKLVRVKQEFGDSFDEISHTLPNFELDILEKESDIMGTFVAFVEDDIDKKQSTLVMLVPGQAHIIGHLIGKAGAEIGRLETYSNVTIRVENKTKMPPGSQERRIYIIGTIAACVETQQLITEKLCEKLKEEGVQQELIKIVIPHESVSHLIGKCGSHIRKLQELTGARIQVEQEDDSSPLPGNVGRTVTIQGKQYNRSMAQYLIARQMAESRSTLKDWQGGIPATLDSKSNFPVYKFIDYDDRYGNTGDVVPSSDSEQKEVTEVSDNSMFYEMLVPDSAVAHLIGRAGVVISQIQKNSGARISFNRVYKGCDFEYGKFQKVTIAGSTFAIQIAFDAINEKLEEIS